MKLQPSTTKLNGLLALTVFALFAACILLVLLGGAGVYRSLTREGLDSYARRTAAQYLTTRVRQGDCGGAVAVEDFGGVQALVLYETHGAERFCTRVYCMDGYLWELFTPAGGTPAPEDGQKLLPAQGLTLSLEHPRLTALLTDETGRQQQLVWQLRSGEEALP
ncbi:MAG: DUF4860 domain-containing protein [Clostridia bacterium]|nr:DUF4860 domain-containing protein [Clostridia bacterium]